MKFYTIHNSLNKKVLGHYPQIKSVVYNCNVWDEPRFIEHIHFKKIDFEPIIANAVLHNKSNLTDLISVSDMGFSNKLLISSKLKKILLEYRSSGLQFFNAPIIKNGEMIKDYWILNFYQFNHEYINIPASKVIFEKKSSDYKTTYKTTKEYIKFDNLEQFEKKYLEALENGETLFIEKLKLYEEIVNEDFFMIKYSFGGRYYVSEKLKQKIEGIGCTGLEFRPIDYSFFEWMYTPDGEREKIYGKA